jgi:hypothetical protein
VRRPPAEPVIVGRDAERGLLAEFLEAGGARAAILTGAAGIGKTALWEWATARAAAADHLVLVSRAGAAEAQLPWVGLTDLLRGTEAPVLAGLPGPQREALRVVMLQSAPGEPADERAVGTALLSVCLWLLALQIGQEHAPGGRGEGECGRVRVLAVADGDGAGEDAGDFDALAAIPVAVAGLAPDRTGQVDVGHRAPSVQRSRHLVGRAADERT